ncbi:MAG: polysaccharide deacetylase family protein [Cytophagales bacterium]|nr:polysaccharide deacetylase family protein [Cytophagales bacterium]
MFKPKEVAYQVFYATGLSHLYQAVSGRKTGMVCYHNVLPDENFSRSGRYHTDFPVSVMERHLRFLAQEYKLRPLPNPSIPQVVLSFDDGMLNNYHVVRPMLQRYGLKAMFAVCPHLVDGQIPHIWRDHFHLVLLQFIGNRMLLPIDAYDQPYLITVDTLPSVESKFRQWIYENRRTNVYEIIQEICSVNRIAYKKEDYDPLRFDHMNWEQIRQLHADGHLIVSHTCSHRVLSFLSDEEKRRELTESRQRIEEVIQSPVKTRIAAECGYECGYLNMSRSIAPGHPLARERFGLPFTVSKPYLTAVASGLHDSLRKMVRKI